jgi:hypothetical protein
MILYGYSGGTAVKTELFHPADFGDFFMLSKSGNHREIPLLMIDTRF